MPQLTTPYDFALAVYNGLTQTNLENAYTYSNREITISFKQPSRVYFASPVTLLDEGGSEASPGTASLFHDSPLLPLASFVDWEQPQTYMANTTMRFPYGVMTLDEGGSSAFLEADITSTDDTQTFTRTTCSRSVATLTRLYPLQDRNRIHGASLLTMVCTMPTMVRWLASILWISRMVYRTYGCVATSWKARRYYCLRMFRRTACARTTSTRTACWCHVLNCLIKSSASWRTKTMNQYRSLGTSICWSALP